MTTIYLGLTCKIFVLFARQEIIGDLHNASLMIDDIEDNSKLRRGVPVAHHIFGVPSVINGANYAYILALERCHALNSRDAMDVFVGELLNLHRGQGHDIMVSKFVEVPNVIAPFVISHFGMNL